jgi:hypothetical protein
MRALSLSQVGLALHYLSTQTNRHPALTPPKSTLATKLRSLKQSRTYLLWLIQRELDSTDLPTSRTGPHRN